MPIPRTFFLQRCVTYRSLNLALEHNRELVRRFSILVFCKSIDSHKTFKTGVRCVLGQIFAPCTCAPNVDCCRWRQESKCNFGKAMFITSNEFETSLAISNQFVEGPTIGDKHRPPTAERLNQCSRLGSILLKFSCKRGRK
jgi:hypothetical protein